jgi:hypothetical protein
MLLDGYENEISLIAFAVSARCHLAVSRTSLCRQLPRCFDTVWAN